MASGPVPSSAVETESRLRAIEALVRDEVGTVHDGRLSQQSLDGQYAPYDFGPRRKPRTGSWSMPNGTRSTGGGTTLGRAGFIWLDAAPGQAIDRMAVNVTGAGGAGSVVRLGIYAPSESDGSPDALILDAGTIDGTSITVHEVTVSVTLPGPVWLVAVPQVALTPVLRTLTSMRDRWSGVETTASGALSATERPFPYIGTDGLTGALPATLTYSGTSTTQTQAIAVSVRFA